MNSEDCICGHAEDEHFKYGVPMTRGRCKLDSVDGHFCIQFESNAAAAEREKVYEEKRVRANRVADFLERLVPTAANGTVVSFEFQDHYYEVREAE